MALSGATDVKAQQRYLTNTAKMRAIPAAATQFQHRSVQILSSHRRKL
jgi:hypothetical protein